MMFTGTLWTNRMLYLPHDHNSSIHLCFVAYFSLAHFSIIFKQTLTNTLFTFILISATINLLQPKMIRIYLLRGVTILMSSIFIYKLLDLQVINTNYETLSENNVLLEIAEYPERGFIYDRNGKLLVANQPAYDVMIIPENALPFDTIAFCDLTGIGKKRLIYNLKKQEDIPNVCPQ